MTGLFGWIVATAVSLTGVLFLALVHYGVVGAAAGLVLAPFFMTLGVVIGMAQVVRNPLVVTGVFAFLFLFLYSIIDWNLLGLKGVV
jgi:hypothetical protein